MDILQIVTALTAIVGIVTSAFYARRAKKAEVRAKEIENERDRITNADQMIELVKKANAEALAIVQSINENLKKENEKFQKIVLRLERAIAAIGRCAYRDTCPAYAELQGGKDADRQGGNANTNGNRTRDHP